MRMKDAGMELDRRYFSGSKIFRWFELRGVVVISGGKPATFKHAERMCNGTDCNRGHMW